MFGVMSSKDTLTKPELLLDSSTTSLWPSLALLAFLSKPDNRLPRSLPNFFLLMFSLNQKLECVYLAAPLQEPCRQSPPSRYDHKE